MTDMRRKRNAWICPRGYWSFCLIGRFIINFCIFIAIKWFFLRQKRQSAADYHYLLVFDKPPFFREPTYLR
ncbi:hypothetical protein AD953_02500 [Acetobacter malorum]|uniref:Uncharacterized protein n=1 Tax=Acetobacter malorum TaxID=178901 RepID=A0A149VGP4_9PROT|nr:hypothetical protein AD953_02500 [Acetobacter malorum]